jgi:hypothetical protein
MRFLGFATPVGQEAICQTGGFRTVKHPRLKDRGVTTYSQDEDRDGSQSSTSDGLQFMQLPPIANKFGAQAMNSEGKGITTAKGIYKKLDNGNIREKTIELQSNCRTRSTEDE